MKIKFTLSALLALLLFTFRADGQDIQKGAPGMWPAFIKYGETAPAFKRSTITLVDANGETAKLTNGKVKQVEQDARGFEHYRYQQFLNGIPIENASLVVHVKNGKISSQNGKWIKDFPGNLSARASVTESSALALALKNIGAKQYKWELPAEEEFLKREQNDPGASFYPKATLVYYSGERDVIPSALRLAYKFDVYAQNPVSRQLIFVDAVSGNILGKRELIHETNATGTAQTAYSGTQTITSDYTGATYRLRETGRGNGINTYNLQTGTNYAAAVDFTDADNNWNNVNPARDEYATDAHWATEKTYDYYFVKYGRNSIDNAGMALNSYLHYSNGYFNAFWDGSRMTYGDGDATNGNRPLTSLDVCGHEITHGVTERTSALVYSYESGAMNEAFSDIFGTAIENFARPGNSDWLIGGDFYTIRSMSNPNAFNDPDTYQGNFWYAGSGDNGGVHINSGVLNFWFYLLTTGGTGTNDHGVSYNVNGIGMDAAAAIAYRLNTFYLVSTSDYYAARTLGIQAAEDLYGIGSPQALETANAFTAVGLYATTCSPVSGLTVSPLMDISATLRWAQSPGAVYYTVDFKKASTTNWLSAGTPTADSVNIGGLTASTLYDWRIRSSCNSNFVTGQFTTAPPICYAPGGFSVNPNNTYAELFWNPALYATGYTVEYKASTDNVWITAGNTATTYYLLTGLAVSVTYDWRVKTNCSFGGSGYTQGQFTTTAQPCDAPTGLNTVHSPGLVTTMGWNTVPGALSYYLQLKWQGQVWPDYEMDSLVSITQFQLVGLMSGLTLDWRVRTNCDSNYSPYSVSQFTTPIPPPSSISVAGITANSAVVNWTAPSSSYNTIFGYTVQYKLSTAVGWTTLASVSTSTLTKTLTGLAPGRTYDVRVRLNGYSVNSTYAQTSFSTPCNIVPSGLTYSNVSPTSAQVKWNAIPGSVSFNLQYKKSTVSSWTTVSGITTNSYNLSGLSANTIYNYQVQLVCTSGTTAYSSPASFTTYCTSSGNNSQEWIDYFKFGSMERFSTFDAGGYFNALATYSPLTVTIGTSGIAGIVSAGFSGSVRNQYYAVYIDYNRNGSFNDPGEKVAGQTAMTNANYYNFTVNIPITATPGITAIRVVMLRQPTTVSPCLTGNRGETEDYYLNLVAPAAFGEPTEPVYTQSETPQSDIQVAPNPSKGNYTISFNDAFSPVQYDIINASGRTVNSGQLSYSKKLQIDITRMPAGLYLLRLVDKSGKTEIQKLIKE
ncbi:MAG: M4 family metallopeptidase [Chitinophagaceae bacterium]|nr:M4 family metallopeptidase [Chitinophagaceae bacterium]